MEIGCLLAAGAGVPSAAAGDHEKAARLLPEFITREVLERMVQLLAVPEPRLRALRWPPFGWWAWRGCVT